jgi:hypothetical protein
MNLNQLPNFRVEDFPSEQSWIGKLFIQLNPFVQAVNQVFSQNVDFSSNIRSVSRQYSISTFQEFSFQWPYSDALPNELRVTQATKGTQKTPTILLPAWSYDSTSRLIQVSRMVEVTDSGVATLSGRFDFTIRVTV